MLDPIKIPTLPTLVSDDVVAVPKSEFNKLVACLNSVIEVVNSQTSAIQVHSEAISTCKQNISNVAKILEDIYDET